MNIKNYFMLSLGIILPFLSNADNKAVSQQEFDQVVYQWLRTYSEAVHMLRTKYYVKNANLTQAMIKSINALISIDPHSSFLDPQSYKGILATTSGEFYGIGIIIGNKNPEDSFIAVIDTVPGNPADQAGVKSGDKILEIDGKSVRCATTDEVATWLKGERYTHVALTVERPGYPELLKFTIQRDVIKDTNTLCYYIKEHGIYYFALTAFSQHAGQHVKKVIERARAANAQGIIIDLRNNTGGLLNAAIDIVSLFARKDSIVVTTRDRNNNIIETYRTKEEPLFTFTIPVFILINNYTASAAEILAGFLQLYAAQENKQIFVVGTTSYGKGSVQDLIPASNNCAFKITTALYYWPNDKTIQGEGVTPDIILNPKFPPNEQMVWVNKIFGQERALKNYIEPHEHKKTMSSPMPPKKELSWKERRRDYIAHDYQIQATMQLIKLTHVLCNATPSFSANRADLLKQLNDLFIYDKEYTLEDSAL